MSPKIKICGITRVQDAEWAIECGADYLGLIFVPESPRSVELTTASLVLEATQKRAQMVGVFKDSPLEQVQHHCDTLSLDLIQCHGQETPDYCQALNKSYIKVFELDEQWDSTVLNDYQKSDFFLFDRPKGNTSARWIEQATQQLNALAPNIYPPFLFAGGLTPDNIETVLKQVHPYAVDVASGVESKPGIKDRYKLKDFCDAVREGAYSCNP